MGGNEDMLGVMGACRGEGQSGEGGAYRGEGGAYWVKCNVGM